MIKIKLFVVGAVYVTVLFVSAYALAYAAFSELIIAIMP